MKDIILFGASRLGEIAYHILKEKYNIIYWGDNDKSKKGKYYYGIEIISIEEIKKYNNIPIIITSEYYQEIATQLKNVGIEDISVFWYVDIDDSTYQKKYFINKIIDNKIFNSIKLDDKFKEEYIKDFSLIYEDNRKYLKNYQNNIKQKNVLVIAYAFPPVGGSGVQRTLKFVKYLLALNWNPIVITVDDDYLTNEKDYTLLEELSSNIKIIKISSSLVYSEQLNEKNLNEITNLIYGLVDKKEVMEKFLNKLQENDFAKKKYIFEPDMYIGWANEVLRNIDKHIDFKLIDIIYTTSSPYSDHLIGYYLKNKYDIPWVADYRDPWITYPYRGELFKEQESLEYYMEKAIIDTADRILHVTPVSTEDYINIFKKDSTKIRTLTNGYDEKDFNGIREYKTNGKFTITYGGTIYENRFPINFIKAINELIEKKEIDKDRIIINFYGKFSIKVIEKIKNYDEFDLINCGEYINHKECLQKNKESNILLLPIGEGEEFKSVYTGKIFEYMRLNVPILSLSPKGSVAEKVIEETCTGINLEYSDINGIKEFILENYIMWINHKEYSGYKINEIKKYERKFLTSKLIDIFDELI